MPRTIPILLEPEYDKVRTSFAELIKFVRTDGVVVGFSDHDREIVYDSVRYRPTLAVNLSDLEKSDDLSVGNSEVSGMLRAAGITDADVLAGRWDRAYWVRYQVDWRNVALGATVIDAGYTGKITIGRDKFTAELLDLLNQVQQAGMIDLTSTRCRANLGDEWCTLDLGPYTVSGTLTDGDPTGWSAADFVARTEDGGYFNRGTVKFTSGANLDIEREVKDFDSGLWTFQLPFPFPIEAGDTYQAVKGCNGTKAACQDFDNIINRQAEDDIAGEDKAVQVGRSE